MYTYTPKRRNQNVIYISFGFLVAAIMGVIGWTLDAGHAYLYRPLALLSALLMLALLARYRATSYTYLLSEGKLLSLDLTVVEVRGKKRSVTCRLSLSSLALILPDTRENRKRLRGEHPSARRYDYCVDIGVPDAVFLVFHGEEDEKELILRLSPDGGMLRLIKEEAEKRE